MTKPCLGNLGRYGKEWGTYQGCGYHSIGKKELFSMAQGKTLAFVGDSEARNVFLAFARAADANTGPYKKHADIEAAAVGAHGPRFPIKLEFKWAPQIAGVASYAQDVVRSAAQGKLPAAIVVSTVLWDTLHSHDKIVYAAGLDLLAERIKGLGVPVFWLSAPTVVDAKLHTEEKKKHMTDAQVESFDNLYFSSQLAKSADTIRVDLRKITKGKETEDGVHYGLDIYDTVEQCVLNAMAYLRRGGNVSSVAVWRERSKRDLRKFVEESVVELRSIFAHFSSFTLLGYLCKRCPSPFPHRTAPSQGEAEEGAQSSWKPLPRHSRACSDFCHALYI